MILNNCKKFIENNIPLYFRGHTIPFKLYEHQSDLIDFFNLDKNLFIKKRRQNGTSSLIVAYSIWYSLKNENSNIKIICVNNNIANRLFSQFKFIDSSNNTLFSEACSCGLYKSKLLIKFKNGSKIKCSTDFDNYSKYDILFIENPEFNRNIDKSNLNMLTYWNRTIAVVDDDSKIIKNNLSNYKILDFTLSEEEYKRQKIITNNLKLLNKK